MISKATLIFVVTMVSTTYFFKPCLAFDDGDFQYWNSESVSWKVNKDWRASLEEEFRFGDDASNFFYQHSDLSVTYFGLVEWLDLGLNYRHIYEEKETKWKEENRPHLNATLKWKLFDLALSNRGRLEYRNREDAENYWRYRDKFTIKLPIKLSQFEIQPYIADEIFYDFDEETLNRNRLYGGFYLKLLKNVKAQIFYLWQSNEINDKWNDTHVLWTKLKLSF